MWVIERVNVSLTHALSLIRSLSLSALYLFVFSCLTNHSTYDSDDGNFTNVRKVLIF